MQLVVHNLRLFTKIRQRSLCCGNAKFGRMNIMPFHKNSNLYCLLQLRFLDNKRSFCCDFLFTHHFTNEGRCHRMMESGLLLKDVAKKLFEAKKMKKLGSPMKTVVTVKRQSDSSVSVKKTTTVSTEK